jgi:hypothetical protein
MSLAMSDLFKSDVFLLYVAAKINNVTMTEKRICQIMRSNNLLKKY